MVPQRRQFSFNGSPLQFQLLSSISFFRPWYFPTGRLSKRVVEPVNRPLDLIQPNCLSGPREHSVSSRKVSYRIQSKRSRLIELYKSATLRLAPVLPTKVAMAQFPDVEHAVSAVQEILSSPYGPHIRRFSQN